MKHLPKLLAAILLSSVAFAGSALIRSPMETLPADEHPDCCGASSEGHGYIPPCPWGQHRTQACKDACNAAFNSAITAAWEDCESCVDDAEDHYSEDIDLCNSLYGPNGSNPDPANLAECKSDALDEAWAATDVCASGSASARTAARTAWRDCMMDCCTD